MPNITLIVAMDKNCAIGKEGKVPWKLSRDMKHFSETTTGKTVVMGRKTWNSLPEKWRPLPDRINIVLSRDRGFIALGGIVMNSVDDVLKATSSADEIFVIGGAEIYGLFLPHASRILLTDVDTEIDDADAFFPELGPEWTCKLLWRHEVDSRNQFSFWVLEYTRAVRT